MIEGLSCDTTLGMGFIRSSGPPSSRSLTFVGCTFDFAETERSIDAHLLSVANVRLVAGSVVAGNAGAISVENTPLGNTFEVAAIGNSASLTGLLTRAGGMIAQLRATLPDVEVIVTPVERIDMPPTTRALTPSHGTPHL